MINRRILVTGSSRGIGKAIALQLAKDGFDIVLHCRNSTTLTEQVQQEIQKLGRQSGILQFDISDREQTKQVIEKDIEFNNAYYGVVCNAGLNRDNSFPTMTGEDWDQVIHTNLDGFYNVLHPIIMPMIRTKQGGRIVTIASISGIMGNRGQVNYSASKAGIIAASKSLAIELAKRKITVNCVAPGLIETDMTHDLPIEEIKKIIPVRRLGKPEEVAGMVSYLISDIAGYVTRQVISINGGII